jgi:antitoxin VapB
VGLNIKSPSAEAAIRELAARTGEGLTEAVEKAVRERLQRIGQIGEKDSASALLARLKPIQESVAAGRRSRKENRSPRELLADLYNEHGLPK